MKTRTQYIAGSYDNSTFNVLRMCQIVFHSSCTILHSYQQWFKFLHMASTCFSFFFFFKILFREEGREKVGEKHQCVVASFAPPTGDLAHNPGMCPDWESNQQPFGSQTSTQSTEPHQPGPFFFFFSNCYSHCIAVSLPRLQIQFYRNMSTQSHVYGCFCYNGRDRMAPKPKVFTIWYCGEKFAELCFRLALLFSVSLFPTAPLNNTK